MSSFTTSRSGSPINLMKNDSYKKYYSVSNNFLKEHKHLLKCTSCNTNLFNSIKQGKFNIHPMLKVLICQKCYDFYTSGELSQDEDGSDKYCRWCGNGGHLYICSQCPYGFCKGCYQNNFPDIVENMSDDNWKCIVCEDGPLHKHQALVHVLLHLSPSKSSRVRKRRPSPDSDTPVNKISKFSEKNNKDKKDKINLDLIDSTTHSNHEDFAIPVLENPNEEFNDKSKNLLLSSINDLQSTMKFGLEESTKLLNKINKSDLDNSSEVLKFYQLLDQLQTTLKSRIENYVGSTRKIIQKSKKINDNSQEKNQKKKNDVLLVESSDSDSEKKTNKLKSLNNENRFEVEENLEANLDNPMNKRRNIKSIIEDKNTSQSTKKAAMNEGKRQLIEQPQTLVYDLMEGDASNDNIILDSQSEVRVHPGIAVKLKPHQVEGVRFMFNSVIESIEEIEKGGKGNGCILAHCMGLGKTLQVVSLIHTLLTTPCCKIRTVMIVCPVSTVHNWIQEFRMWTKPCKETEIKIFDLSRDKKQYERNVRLKDWQSTGGVLIIGYNMLRTLGNPKQRIKKTFKEENKSCLFNPGADIIVCDEGHLLKNEKSSLSQTIFKIKTLRRIILTGTPLQNNLSEYHCMVSFVKPNLLGTRREFQNRFVNPITNGQFADSNANDLFVMKKRAHVLHKMLEGTVQRFDYSVLTPFLPPKFEFSLLIKLTNRQIQMYQHYLDFFASKPGSGGKSTLFADFQTFQRISNHPRVLQLRLERHDREKARLLTDSKEKKIENSSSSETDDDASLNDETSINSEEENEKIHPNSKKENIVNSDEDNENKTEFQTDWWKNYIDNEEIMDDINESGKLVILFEILKECELIGDKLLIFSQSLFSLDLIEYFLKHIDKQSLDKKLIRGYDSTWTKGKDYFRLDGSTQCEVRHEQCNHFNNPTNSRARLFLISTRAGGLGINLTSANRVIIFDASWNPSNDMQSIFRVYRFGQIKPCFIYRFLAQGTMEEKVYDRQVTKLSLSCRVVDEQQIERHFTLSDLAELYKFEPSNEMTKSHGLPRDSLLADLMIEFPQWILDYHEHDSLLQNKEEEELDEEERKVAWQDYEIEKKGKLNITYQRNYLNDQYFNQCLNRLVRQFPNTSFEEIKKKAQTIAANHLKIDVEYFQQLDQKQK